MTDQRFAGQEGQLVMVNAATNEEIGAGFALEGVSLKLPFEVVKKRYFGELGPDFRAFGDGWEVEGQLVPRGAAAVVAFANLLVAKAQGLINDEMRIALKFRAPDGEAFRFVGKDAIPAGLPFDISAALEFMKLPMTWQGKLGKFEEV
jgi:hypothetical protein